MTAPTAWAALPNARHIDRVLADLQARPDAWAAARAAAWDAAWDAAWVAAWDAARAAAWAAARDATWAAAWDAARAAPWAAAWGAARARIAWDAPWAAAWAAAWALIAWDDVAYILALPSGAVRMLIETCTDHHKHAAVLLLPACVAFNGEGETA